MVRVEKVTREQFGLIYPLLERMPYRLPRATWEKLFFNQWDKSQDYIGYALMEEGAVRGFIGVKLSEQEINGSKEKFCNITSWVVDEAHQSHGIFLLFPLLRLEGCTLTDFTPIDRVYTVLRKMGFKDLAAYTRVIPPSLMAAFGAKKCEIVFGEDVAPLLNGVDKKICDDHKSFAVHFCVKSDEGACYCVATRVRRRRIPFMQLHYIGNPAVFTAHAGRIAGRLCLKGRAAALIIDEAPGRYAGVAGSFLQKRGVPSVYKSEKLAPEDIASVYSELILTGGGI